MALATGLYVGYLPKAPGTWGSLLALPIHFLLSRLAFKTHMWVLVCFFVAAVLIAGSAEKILDRKDPGVVVIDEIMGMLIALLLAPDDFRFWILGFVLFRLFDITKPFPIRWIDRRINGGIGIVMDDVLAGFFSLILLEAAGRLFFR